MLKNYFYESIDVKKEFIETNEENLEKIIQIFIKVFESWNKVIIAGNWGSAADAQHWAAEFVGRYKMERKSLPAIALTTDTSALTAIWNDYGFEQVFSRQLEWLGNAWDLFVGISTSGNSQNIIEAVKLAKEKWLIVFCLLWKDGGKLKEFCDYSLVIRSDSTARIQETHLVVYHSICEEVEKRMF